MGKSAVLTLYREQLLEHNRAPHRWGRLDAADACAHGCNALCGDELSIEIRSDHGRICGYAFEAEACAITTAVASILGDRVIGMDMAALELLQKAFERILCGTSEQESVLGELNAFADLVQFSARRKCARLPLATLIAAMAGQHVATTEEG